MNTAYQSFRNYVIGFGYPDEHNLVLIQKNRPPAQAGKFNVPGGKVEPFETMYECMSREWKEETGISTRPDSWTYVGKLFRPDDFQVSIFTQLNPKFKDCCTTESEEIHIMETEAIWSIYKCFPDKFMPNVVWLHEFIRSPDFKQYQTVVDVFYHGKEPV